MAEIQIQYVCSDGKIFPSMILAEKHEKTLLTAEQQEKVKRVEKALSAYVATNKNATSRDILHWLAKNWESL